MLRPRDYQEHAHAALIEYVHRRPKDNPLVVLPTGTGKSLAMAMFVYHMAITYPTTRFMLCTHVKELIAGNHTTLKRLWPDAPSGIYSAGLNEREENARITFAGIQSVVKRAESFRKIDFFIVDEAHLVGKASGSQYIKFINDLRRFNPAMIVIGFTATAFRMGMGMLTDGGVFDSIAFDGSDGAAFLWFVKQGYLSRLVPRKPEFQLDSNSVGVSSGEFIGSQASSALRDQNILQRSVDTMIQAAREEGRKKWLIFCQSIEDADLVADMFSYKGHAVKSVHSQRSDRDEVLQELRDGKLQGVTNNNILTTGFDLPEIDMIGMLRLTRSPGLWVQMLGRGTRPVYAPGFDLSTQEGRLAAIEAGPKHDCLVLDFVQNTDRLGPINYPEIPRARKGGGGEAPARACPACGTYNHISHKACDECGFVFPPPEKIKEVASDSELIREQEVVADPVEVKTLAVSEMVCGHNPGKKGKPDTLRVDYFSQGVRYSVWLCFDHEEGSFPRIKAVKWWSDHGGREPPLSVADALDKSASLTAPETITLKMTRPYPEIVGYKHAEESTPQTTAVYNDLNGDYIPF